jgi:cyclomaltodextrinase / maltogenic alpha-amylase / neopullulanase
MKKIKPFLQPLWSLLALLILISGMMSCRPQVREDAPEGVIESNVEHPDWSINANIYEVNIRQYTPEGTFLAFSHHLDRLKQMGVDILWLMPITPIGEENRKGTLGSYYSVKDYRGINPEFGTMEDFQRLVRQIHAMDMYVILDWVANHTAWDHPWTQTNPEFYTLDQDGNFVPPVEDWSDVIDLDYSNTDVWDAMIAEMRFWVEEIGVDGFRCDVAYMVPTQFWERARAELQQIKPIYMLAEAETPELHINAFEMGYGWTLHHIMNRIAQGESTVAEIDNYFFVDNAGNFPWGSYKMYFITNHDENSWAGTEFDRLGEGKEAFAVLTATIPGMILIYSGQEAGFDRQLEFFEKDSIDWDGIKYHEFYQTLLHLKTHNRALWNGAAGAPIERIHTNADQQIFAFVREHEQRDHKIFAVFNLSDQNITASFRGERFPGVYYTLFTGLGIEIDQDFTFDLEPWAYYVFVR